MKPEILRQWGSNNIKISVIKSQSTGTRIIKIKLPLNAGLFTAKEAAQVASWLNEAIKYMEES